MLFAAALTVVIVLGYGAYTAWNAITGGDGSGDAPAAADGYEGTVERAIFLGGGVIGQGLDARLVSDLDPFLASTNAAIEQVARDRDALTELATTATGPQADVIASTQQSYETLRIAMFQWRDAVVNLRLADVPDAHAAMDDALALLRADLDRWRSLPDEG